MPQQRVLEDRVKLMGFSKDECKILFAVKLFYEGNVHFPSMPVAFDGDCL